LTSWIGRCQSIYRLAARAFPHEFRMVCGDGLERLGEDLAPVVWRQHGALGLLALFADIAVRLPVEYVSMWLDKLKETTMPGDCLKEHGTRASRVAVRSEVQTRAGMLAI
jgi:hypothetical protein